VLCGAGGGDGSVVAVVGGTDVVDHAVMGGAVNELPRVVGAVEPDVESVDGVVEVDAGLVVVVVTAEVGVVVADVGSVFPPRSWSSISDFDKCATSFGATPLATWATAAKARVTAITTPTTQTPARTTPRCTGRFSSTRPPELLKAT
jgi:hypothetical protein